MLFVSLLCTTMYYYVLLCTTMYDTYIVVIRQPTVYYIYYFATLCVTMYVHSGYSSADFCVCGQLVSFDTHIPVDPTRNARKQVCQTDLTALSRNKTFFDYPA